MGVLLQVGIGVAIVVAVYYIALAFLHDDRLAADDRSKLNNPQQRTLVMDGWIDSLNLVGKRFTTINKASMSFLPMPRSYNRNGGAQFSYAFWMFFSGDASQKDIRNKDVFVKGDTRPYRYERTRANIDNRETVMEQETDMIIKCPRLRFGDRFSDFVLEFNTHDNMNQKVFLNSQENDTDISIRHNLMSMVQKKWVLITLTFEDNIPINDFENGIVVRMFVNDLLYHTHRINSALRQNHGDLHLFPSGHVPGFRIADFAYYNYALGFKEIKEIFKRGRPEHRASMDEDPIGTPLYMSEYNKIDVHNR